MNDSAVSIPLYPLAPKKPVDAKPIKCDRTKIHKGCCKHCPSARPDKCQEEIDMDNELKDLSKEHIAHEYLFACAWRTDKLCKGFCDNMGIDQDFLDNLYK